MSEQDTQSTPSPGPQPAPAGPPSVEEPDDQQDLAKELAREVAQMRDRWQRAVAELENLRKRSRREVQQAGAAERARVAVEWLPVVDNLELALQHAQADPASIIAGVAAVRDQALAVLARFGFERSEDLGLPFDPTRHEAAQVIDAPDAQPGTVVKVLRPGYTADGGLLRPAVVAVARKPPQ
jgi:molecular chaperone GrpE